MSNRKGIARTLITVGALLAIPVSHTTIATFASDCMERAQELWEAQAHEGKKIRTVTANSLSGNTGDHFNDFSAEQNLSCRFLPLTLANVAEENVLGMQRTGGGGAMLVPHPSLPSGDSKNTVSTQLLITAGIAPLENVVAHGNASSTNTQVAAPQVAAAAAPPATPPTTSTALRNASSTATPVADESVPLPEPPSPALDAGLTWTGNHSDVWDNSTENWNNGSAYFPSYNANDSSTLNSATFDDASTVTDINVVSAQTLQDMTIAGLGYSFTGGGNITVLDQLYIAASGDTSFGSANNLTVGTSLTLQSEADTTTTFGATVTTGTLNIENCAHHGGVAGKYIFEDDVTVNGAANINLGGSQTADLTLLEVRGDFSADSLTLDGSAQKSFKGTVTVTNGITISGIEGNSLDGTTSFAESVTLGGTLSISGNSQASFHAELTMSNDQRLATTLNDGVLLFDMITTLSAGELYDLGVVTLTGQGGLSLGARTSARVDVAGNDQDFSVGGAKRADVTLLSTSNVRNFHVNSGIVNLISGSESEADEGGKVSGEILVQGGGTLTLNDSNIFAATDSGDSASIIVRGDATLDIGNTTQAVPGTIILERGHITGDDGSLLTASGSAPSISFSGSGNSIDAPIELGTGNLPIKAPGGTDDSRESNTLTLRGDITGGYTQSTNDGGETLTTPGQGSITVSGKGSVIIDRDLSYMGNIIVGDLSQTYPTNPPEGFTLPETTQLVLSTNAALKNANKVTVGYGADLSVTHNGSSTVLNGAGGLELMSGASLSFNNLYGHEDTAAITLVGGLRFNGDITFNINFNAPADNEDVNLKTYDLITSSTGITGAAGGVTVKVDGIELEDWQYTFGYYKDANNQRHFTFTMLDGKRWESGTDGYWLADADGDGVYDNWSEGKVGLYALLRQNSGEDQDIHITLDGATATKGIYMDGSTDYTIQADRADRFSSQSAAFAAAPLIRKLGSGSLTLDNIVGTPGTVVIEEGAFILTGNSSLINSAAITIADFSYVVPGNGSDAVLDASAVLRLEQESSIVQGEARIDASANKVAELRGVTISGIASTNLTSGTNTTNAILSGYSSGLGTGGTHSISNVDISSFAVDNVSFIGTGSMAHMTINEGVIIGDGSTLTEYSLGADMAVLSAITVMDNATVKVDSNTLIGVGRQGTSTSIDEFTTRYTPFNIEGNGTLDGWTELTAANFRIRGTELNKINGVKVTVNSDGTVDVGSQNNDFKFIRWDSELHKNSWITPTVGKYYNSKDYLTVASEKSTEYSYANLVSGGDANCYVVHLAKGSGVNYATLVGAQLPTSADSRADVWIYDEGSAYLSYIGGATEYEWPVLPYYGDSHLQIAGALSNSRGVQSIFGGSQGVEQTGDSYLTIEAGNYTTAVAVAAGSQDAVHHGNSYLHLKGGRFGTVYGGSLDTYTDGSTYVLIDGSAQVATVFGADYSAKEFYGKLSGNVTIDLKGGTVGNVFAASNWDNASRVAGDVTVNLYAGGDGNTMLTTFTEGAYLWGGAKDRTQNSYADGISTLAFMNEGTYELWGVDISRFDRFSLAEGAKVYLNADKFNVSSDLIISGAGIVEVGDAPDAAQKAVNHETHHVTLTDGARLNIRTSFYYNTNTNECSQIHVQQGSTLDISGYPNASDAKEGETVAFAIDLSLAGYGTDGKGALYKAPDANSSTDSTTLQSCSNVNITSHASVGVESGTEINMIGSSTAEVESKLDIGQSAGRGYILTKTGQGSFGMYHTRVTSGTLNVVEGTLVSAAGTNARTTDVVLHKGAELRLASGSGYAYYDEDGIFNFDADTPNTLTVETLSGEGSINLNAAGRIILETNAAHTDFLTAYNTPAEGQLFYNDKGYEYAHYSGTIADNASTGSGQIVKRGAGTQYFEGSESTYKGGTVVENGILYLTGTSTAVDGFASGKAETAKGVVGAGTLLWGIEAGSKWNGKENVLVINQGKVYLGDGVRIFNNGTTSDYKHTDGAVYTPDIIIGVETSTLADGNINYHEATYSGIITTEKGSLVKEGAGTLGLDQVVNAGGGIDIQQGTLDLFGWADVDQGSITQEAGTSLMFSYDGSYAGGADVLPATISADIVARGEGDTRWETDKVDTTTGLTRTGNMTAAIISDIGARKQLELAGNISDAVTVEKDAQGNEVSTVEKGNLLHSGEGELTLSGTNSYSGGTTITRGTVIIASDSALGATATAATAKVVAKEAATLKINHETHNIATYKVATDGITLAADGNDIDGVVFIGSSDEATAGLNMRSAGYNASRTELGINDVLLFDGTASSNWDGELEDNSPLNSGNMGGAGILAGDTGAKVIVTDGKTDYTEGGSSSTMVYFQVTDAMTGAIVEEIQDTEGGNVNARSQIGGYRGDLVVEGDKALLHIQGGAITGGNYKVSGMGSQLDAGRSIIEVEDGKELALISLGDKSADANSTAKLSAYRVSVKSGGKLSTASSESAYMYTAKELNEASRLPMAAALNAYEYNNIPSTNAAGYVVNRSSNYSQIDAYKVAKEHLYDWNFDTELALNTRTAGTLDTEDGLTLYGGSIYESLDSNTSLGNTKLILDISDGKIKLAGNGSYTDTSSATEKMVNMSLNEYLNTLSIAGENSTTRQWVLFTDVSAFEVMDGTTSVISGSSLSSAGYTSYENQLYVVYANQIFEEYEAPQAMATEAGDGATGGGRYSGQRAARVRCGRSGGLPRPHPERVPGSGYL